MSRRVRFGRGIDRVGDRDDELKIPRNRSYSILRTPIWIHMINAPAREKMHIPRTRFVGILFSILLSKFSLLLGVRPFIAPMYSTDTPYT